MNESMIFAAALEKASDAERADFLNEACAGDEKLRLRVEALLRAHAAPDSQLDAAAVGPATTDIGPITEKTGTRIGPYRLMEQIGEGGFGVVFVAEQQEPVRRKVALKLIKPGMDSSQVIARFEAERQALAMMDHPNIARVLDAGATETGRPYFVMELVRGISITEYCDKNQLNPSERMEIFVTVCHAIQHAHQKGIIHRDIKPSNVLVTSHDGRPVAKVIDFGVAKAIHQQLTERTIYTQFAQMIGTPLYMSPEQAEMSGLDIDTRSDIYSLGVLLYELFTGSTPLEKSRLVSAAFDEVRRLIREDEPLRPSQRLSTSATLSSLAANRKTEPARLSHQMKRELDWIVMKALEKDRTRRYETAGAFAADIGRYLRDEQVEACPPSITYQLRKFIRRNRFVFVSGSLVAAILLMGIIVSTWFAIRANEQQNLAQMARLGAEQERDRAEKAQQTAMVQSERAEVQRQNAETARASEKSQRSAAEQERDKATALSEALALEKQELSRQKEDQRRMLYISDMNLVQTAWQADNVSRVLELLNSHRPHPGQTDLRGFEWHYWNRQCHSDLRTVKLSESISRWTSRWTVLNADGTRFAATLPYSGGDEKIKIWNAHTGAELCVLSFRRDPEFGNTYSMAFHPDGNRLAVSILRRNSIELIMWDIATGTSLFTIAEMISADPVREFATGSRELWIRNDGARLAMEVARSDGEVPWQRLVKFWDAKTGQELAAFPLDRQQVSGLAISPDGLRIAFATSALATDGSAAVSSGVSIKILNVESLEDAVTIPLSGFASFRFSPDGARLFVSENTNALQTGDKENEGGVFDSASGEKLFSLPDTDRWIASRMSPDGNWLALVSAIRPRTVMLYNTANNREPVEIKGHSARISAVGFSSDGQRLFTAAENGQIKTWDVAEASRSEPSQLASTMQWSSFLTAVSCDGRRIATAPRLIASPTATSALSAEARKNVVTLRDDAGKVMYETPELDGPIHWLKFSPDGRRLAACALNPNADVLTAAQFCVWETASGAELLALRLPKEEFNLAPGAAFSPDGSRLAVVVNLGPLRARTSAIKVLDIDAKREVWESDKIKQSIADLRFSPNGGLILGVPDSKRLAVWDAKDGRMLWNDQTDIGGLGFSNDSTQIFGYKYRRQEIQLWDATSGVELVNFRGPFLRQSFPDRTKIALSPNGRHLSAASSRFGSGDAVICDLDRPERELLTLKGHSFQVETLAFSPDSRRIVTSAGFIASTGEIKLWDAESGQELLTLPGAARNLAFDARGAVLIGEMGSDFIGDICVRRWDASPLAPQVEARQMVEALTAPHGAEPLPLVTEILARIDADRSLPDETRAAAVSILNGLRREKELNQAAWAIALLPNQPPERYSRALQYLEEVCAIDPHNRESWSTRALAHYRMGQMTEALAALEHSRVLHAANKLALPSEDLTILAMTQHHMFKLDEARSTLEQVRRSASRNELEWRKLLSEAETLVKVPRAADNPELWIGRKVMPRRSAVVTSGSGDVVFPVLPFTVSSVDGDRLGLGDNSIARSEVVLLEDANLYYENDMQAGGDTVGSCQLRGDAWRALGRFDRAIEDFSAAIQLNPSNSYIYLQRGSVWLDHQRALDKALADFDAGLRIMPNSNDLLIARGRTLLDQGKFDDALQSFNRAIHFSPTLGGAYAWRAYVWSAKDDKEKMLHDFDKAILLRPDDSGVWTMRAWLLATSPNSEHRNGDLAVKDGMKACELTNWQDYNCLENLAAAYAETDDFENAVMWQQKAIAIAPPDWRADFESRLKLYQKDQKYRHIPRTPAATDVISPTTDTLVK